MGDAMLVDPRIVAAYRMKTPGSEHLAREARKLFPSGVTHDARYLEPYGIYVHRAQGSHKWDVDGNEYIDYTGGHGALLLGHNHRKVAAAIREALENGTHFGAGHALEIRWAELVEKLIASAGRVRFTASGTEATLMAVRLARAFTGRSKIVRFIGHFHGWNDHVAFGVASHLDGSPAAGVLREVAENVVLLSQGDVEAVRELLSTDDDIACVLLEPTGACFGMAPVAPNFVGALRELTARYGAVLVFDEVLTGFRVTPGGAQAYLGITPDLTALAKVLAGGLPGGAVAGRKEILDLLDFGVSERAGRERVQHTGTSNANPLSAAAGSAALEIIDSTDACHRASASAGLLRARLNQILEDEGVPWAAYGAFSAFHIFTNPRNRPVSPSAFDASDVDFAELMTNPPRIVDKLRVAMLVNGIDIGNWPGGTCSIAHTDEDIASTAEAFREALRMLKGEGEL